MLKTIVDADLESKLILIQDTASASSKRLFQAFVFNHSRHRSIKYVNLISSENLPKQLIEEQISSNVVCTEVFPDLLQWIRSCAGDKIELSILEICSRFTDLETRAVLIDSVNPFLWHCGIVKFARELSALSQKAQKVVCCVHKDALLQSSDDAKLKYISTTNIDILKRLDNGSLGGERYLVDLRHRKQDGRLDRSQKEVVTIDSALNVSSSVYVAQVERAVLRTVDMASLTTFNLGVEMKPSEKEARDRLVLPYMKKDGGDVVYEADDADLEEDPDDDLEL